MAACRRTLEAYAEECRTPGDERTKQQRMADCLVDLILRPGINGPVQIGLTVVAGVDTLAGGDEPGEVDGHPVPAVVVRELAYTLGLLPRPEAETVPDAAPETETVTAAAARFEPEAPEPEAVLGRGVESLASAVAAGSGPAAPTPGPAAAVPDQDRRPPLRPDEAAAARLGELLGLRTIAGTALAHLPAVAVVEEISGQLLALTEATQIRHTATCGRPRCRTGKQPCTHPPRGPGLGPPADSPGYSPSDPLARFVRARDRRCRFPGCRAAAIRCDLDHNTSWPHGATSAGNLCCLCRHHHRLSHQAPGWTMRRLSNGGLAWTTPGGDTITTQPPRYGTDDDLPPPTPGPEQKPPAAATATRDKGSLDVLERLRNWPPPPPDPNDEPAPF